MSIQTFADFGDISNPQDVTVEISKDGPMGLQLSQSPKATIIGGSLTRSDWKYVIRDKSMLAIWMYACTQQKAVRVIFDATGITSLIIINW